MESASVASRPLCGRAPGDGRIDSYHPEGIETDVGLFIDKPLTNEIMEDMNIFELMTI